MESEAEGTRRAPRLRGSRVLGVPDRVLGRLGREGAPGAGHDLGDGSAAPRSAPQSQRHAARRPHSHVQDRRRQRAAPARSQGSPGDDPVRGREREGIHHELRKHLRRLHRRDPARPARIGAAGRRQALRRTRARSGRPHADRREGPWRHQHPRRRQADEHAEGVRHLPPLAAVGTLRASPRGRRHRQAEARLLLRRGAPALRRCARGARHEGRAGGTAHPVEGRRRVLRDAEPARRARVRPRPARQSRAARAARLHAARPESGEDGGEHAPRESEARHREGHHRTRRRRGARLLPRREGPAGDRRARLRLPALLAHRPGDGHRAPRDDRRVSGLRDLREGRRPRVRVREAPGPPRQRGCSPRGAHEGSRGGGQRRRHPRRTRRHPFRLHRTARRSSRRRGRRRRQERRPVGRLGRGSILGGGGRRR